MLAYERLDVYRSSIELSALCARAIMDVCHILGIIDPETDRDAKELIRRIVSMLTRLAKASTTTITITNQMRLP